VVPHSPEFSYKQCFWHWKRKSWISLLLGAIFQCGLPLILPSSISAVLIAIATWSWCLSPCFLGQRIQWDYFWICQTNSSLGTYHVNPIFANKDSRKINYGQHIYLPLLYVHGLGSKLTFCWSQSAMRLFTLLSQIKKSTYLSPNYTVLMLSRNSLLSVTLMTKRKKCLQQMFNQFHWMM